jgi:hypothetical protein
MVAKVAARIWLLFVFADFLYPGLLFSTRGIGGHLVNDLSFARRSDGSAVEIVEIAQGYGPPGMAPSG